MYETSRYGSTKNSSWTIYKLSIYKSSWSIYKLSIYEIENPICYTLSSIEKIWILKTLFLIYHGALIIEENWQKHVHHKLSKTVDFCVCVFFFFTKSIKNRPNYLHFNFLLFGVFQITCVHNEVARTYKGLPHMFVEYFVLICFCLICSVQYIFIQTHWMCLHVHNIIVKVKQKINEVNKKYD